MCRASVQYFPNVVESVSIVSRHSLSSFFGLIGRRARDLVKLFRIIDVCVRVHADND